VDAIVIHTKIVNDKVWYYIDFYLHKAGKKYKLYDVYVDGASVLMDYQHQFYDIIETKGFSYLLDRLNARFKELDAG
jgi:ABC-type transporter MlaC component